jgi:hypothetical protein
MPLVFRIEEASSKISGRESQVKSLELVTILSEQEKTEATEIG